VAARNVILGDIPAPAANSASNSDDAGSCPPAAKAPRTCLLRTKSQQHQQRELFHWRILSPRIWHMRSEYWTALRLASCVILSRPTNSSFLWSHSLRVSSAHPARPHRWSAYLAMGNSSSDLTEPGCQISCC